MLKRSFPRLAIVLSLVSVAAPAGAGPGDPFPEKRPTDRQQALELISTAAEDTGLATRIRERLAGHSTTDTLEARRSEGLAVALLSSMPVLQAEQEWQPREGVRVRYTAAQGSSDRIDSTDLNGNGVPDLVEAISSGIDQARDLLVDGLGLRAPAYVDVVVADLEGRTGGYIVAARRSTPGPARAGWLIVLDGSHGDGNLLRHAAIRQYARAVAWELSGRFPAPWAEALATWAEVTIDGTADHATAEIFSKRIDALESGLFASDPALAAGNAIWLAFLYESYGPVAVRIAIEELASEGAPAACLDRALRRSSAHSLTQALREFHLWTLLVGPRADAFHFPFAADLRAPAFASINSGLPALSVLADAPVAVWGASQVRFDLNGIEGGLRLHFEGEYPARRWEADLVLLSTGGAMQRLALDITPEGRGEVAVPLDRVAEAWLLVRHLGGGGVNEGQPRRYTYTAHREPDYPMDLVSLDAVEDEAAPGVVVSWETASEQDVAGFDVLRRSEDGGVEVSLNPLWIPAMGDATKATSYVYIDQSAQPGASYVYRVQAITRTGLTARSEAVVVRPPTP